MCACRESVNSLGQESNSWALKEGGLASIRDDESEGECRHIPSQFVVCSCSQSVFPVSVPVHSVE